MKKTLIVAGLTFFLGLLSASALAGASKSVSFRLSANLPAHPGIDNTAHLDSFSQSDADTLISNKLQYFQQESRLVRNEQIVLVRSFTIR